MGKIKQSDFNKLLDRYVQENHIVIDNMTTANFGDGLNMYLYVKNAYIHKGMPPLEVKETMLQVQKLFTNYLNKAKGF